MLMQNTKSKKVPFDKDCLMETLKFRNTSIRKLGADYNLCCSSKSIHRGLKDQKISSDLLDALGQYLDVDPDYLSGKYHRLCEKFSDDIICRNLKHDLHPSKFPYILKQQKEKHEDKFLYKKYLEYLLILHDISTNQFDSMTFKQQKDLQLDLENAVIPVLMKHFSQNALGQNLFPEIYKLYARIDNYAPDTP